MGTIENSNIEYYDQISDSYDKKHHISQHDFLIFKKQLDDLFDGTVSGLRVLDCGCGTGRGALKFALLENKVVAIDISDKMVRVCRQNAEHDELTVTTSVSDCSKMPFADGVFDIVTTSAALHHIESLDRALREFWRVLKPGGRCILIAEPKQAIIRPAWMIEIKERLSAKFDYEVSGMELTDTDPDVHIFKLDRLETVFRKIGFSSVKTSCFFTLSSIYRDLLFFRLRNLEIRNRLLDFFVRFDNIVLAWVPDDFKSLFNLIAKKDELM